MRAEKQPLVEALRRYCRSVPLPFHTPGHLQGRAAPPSLRRWWGRTVFAADLTEVPALGDLYTPSGPVAEAQELAAVWAGARHSFFLVGGSTVGIIALFLAALRPGDKVLLPRAAHRSAVAALCLSGAEPVFVPSPFSGEWGILLPPLPSAYAERLALEPGVRALFCLYPDYYGLAIELELLANLAREKRIPLLVDAAHGTLFGLHPSLPPKALACGAEAAVESAHKRLSGLTQTAWLHLRGERLGEAEVREALALLQTSSPSYLLMASLDAARQYWSGARAEKLVSRLLELAAEAADKLAALEGVRVLRDLPGYRLDFTRLVLNFAELGLSGLEVARRLEELGVIVEMADFANVLLFLSPGHTRRDIRRLVKAVIKILGRAGRRKRTAIPPFPFSPLRLLPREAWLAPAEWVPLKEAVGRVASGQVIVSPPGVPLLLPGEEVTPEVEEYVAKVRAAGANLQGVAGEELKVKVVK
ncbi:aminotransferase class I/II-fold pyridoxal phosphate-dependent enzyme [Ammonifex thiophilus]|uniref:Aminotransferase class I/II-fold pyridoxal phosphate-dependent enzyme n=1 Tax=Ammonifex thiophilus TaxID=444093 RepID=A0A3D8P5K8_9THEO|nr:aminotransferase class I/II-fold pyridoxal phosphate-dependent enzyme [Ammonifex thiophilus]RDV84604.1 aminotransferase class I/II-fold pyridoxal phosphate-dependent enzyme [Ammonifex thiophilus]